MSDYQQILKTYDRQIIREIKKYYYIENCVSFWRKKLFVEARNLSISDWKKIRDKRYWEIKNTMIEMGATEIELHQFTHEAIINYKKHKI